MAPRQLQGPWPHRARGALIGLGVWLASLVPVAACVIPPTSQPGVVAESIVTEGDYKAWYADLTDRYGHGVLGDALEPASLHFLSPLTSAQCGLSVTLQPPHVFEDVAPRLFDVTGDGIPELIAVRSHAQNGAQLVIYAADRMTGLHLMAKTPYIGTRNRWLAPVGIADLDGDGAFEIAFIDRPHLAKRLRLWRFQDGKLVHLADHEGLTNHRIGEDFITGGLRICDGRPELLTANANWSRIMSTTFDGQQLLTRDIGRFSKSAMDAALGCN